MLKGHYHPLNFCGSTGLAPYCLTFKRKDFFRGSMVEKKFRAERPLIYLAHPYIGTCHLTTQENIEATRRVMWDLMQQGLVVLCPNILCAGGEYIMPELEGEDWLARDLLILKACGVLYVAGRWRESTGCRKEIKYAEKLKIPIYYSEHTDAEHLAWLLKRERV